ncbi:MAG: polyprenyl synthetase family protein [Chloroflexi bacterium]|nr:polyprenyl synthetase family protein [Chloroflexota bacterium]
MLETSKQEAQGSQLDISEIYEPVINDLRLVEESLKQATDADFPGLSSILHHILRPTGKRLRPALTLLAGKVHDYNLDLLIPMATGVELLHTATLVHDDMIDNSLVRRGSPTVNHLWNNGAAVLAGDFLFAKSADLVASTRNVYVMQLFARTLMTICSGELRQQFSAFDWRQSREHYFAKIARKTASLFSMATESGATLSGAGETTVQSLKEYGYNLGMAFQIADDILDYTGDEAELGKPVGSDLLQGTLTLPGIMLVEARPEQNPIERMFATKQAQPYLGQAIEMIRESSIIKDSYETAASFCAKAVECIGDIPDGVWRKPFTALADYVIERRR